MSEIAQGIPIEKIISELKELKEKSTKVVGWYSHPGSVRGPFCRWFEITDVQPEYQKHVADKWDDTRYCAAAMNYVPRLLEYIGELELKLKTPAPLNSER